MYLLKVFFVTSMHLFAFLSVAQENIDWRITFDANNSTIYWDATLDEGWYIYSQFLDEASGPIPTEFDFKENDKITHIGKVHEPEVDPAFDPSFGSNLKYHKNTVQFSCNVSFSTPTTLEGTILYMLCNEKSCLPPSLKKFNVELKN